LHKILGFSVTLALRIPTRYFRITIDLDRSYQNQYFSDRVLVEENEILRDTVKLGYRVEKGKLQLALSAIKSLAKVVEDGFLAVLSYVLLPPAAPLLKLSLSNLS
jgi:hypothetical protein